MASTKNMQEEAMASIDTAKAIVDKILSIMELVLVSPSLSLSFSTNPIGFLLQILKHLGVTYEQLRQWLIYFLTAILPVVELSVKTILLTNLKNMISCSVDPRIPEKYRKRHKGWVNNDESNTSQEYGIDINIESIDFMDKLSISPLSEYGSELYFGLKDIEDSYKFARADDFDAFLWFVIHKGKFPNPTRVSSLDDFKNGGLRATNVTPDDTNGSLLGEVKLEFKDENNPSKVLLGNTFAYNGTSHTISMCIDRVYDTNNNCIENTLVPVSDDWTSVNWYARRANTLTKNLGITKGAKRNYSKERALCNLQYIDQASSDSPITGLVNNKLRFTILPRPYIHIPDMSKGEPPWRFKKMLFNSKGEYDLNGKYTFASSVKEIPNGDMLGFYVGNELIAEMGIRTGKTKVTNKDLLLKNLIECYPGLTVFEFNYDYVMSLKLFDAKVMATTLLDSLIDMQMGINVGFKEKGREISDKLAGIIKRITNDSEINDCVFTFDNSKYDTLLRKSEERRAKRHSFGNTTTKAPNLDDVREMLSEYDTVSDGLHEQSEILHRVISQAAFHLSDGVPEKERMNIEYSFVMDLIENLINAIIQGVLSPKVLLLLEVNQTLMGGTWEKFTFEDLLKAMVDILVSIIKEVKDLIIQELLKLVLSQLDPIIEMLKTVLLREQLENYADIVMDMIRNCPTIWFKFGNQFEGTKLDTVDYADIDPSSNKEGDEPSTKNCK